MRWTALALRLALALTASIPAAAAAPRSPSIPPELQPWREWVLEGHERELCPQLPGLADPCAWPSRLELDLTATGGRFTQQWSVAARSRVPLPGGAEAWPLESRVDGQPAVVLADESGSPAMWLDTGSHRITGTFAWERLPESLRVPPATGLIALAINGRAVTNPSREIGGQVWLQAGAAPETEEAESLSLAVHRRVTDDIPLTLITRLLIDVSGRAREVTLGPVLPEGFIPLAIDSPIPARLEADGMIRLQVRPGRSSVTVTARHVGAIAELKAPAGGESWAPDEVWTFDARPDLRVVSVEGAPAIDPRQTSIPDEWRSLPAYRLMPGETLQLVESQRGDAEPAADQLSLRRVLWLDFDGRGITAQDQLGGTLSRSWRLESQAPWMLGRANVGGEDQLLTRRAPGAAPGLEIRQRQVSVIADSRLEGNVRSVPAVGWDADVSSLSAMLQLPPGWRLLAAPGADIANGTWISRWTLLDLFLALIITIAVLKLWGWPAGLLALATMTLTVTEGGAPKWAWLFVVALEAIHRVLKEGTAQKVVQATRIAVLGFVMIVAAGFMVVQARNALHPQLESPWDFGGWSTLVGDGRYERTTYDSAPAAVPTDYSQTHSTEQYSTDNTASLGYVAANAAPVEAQAGTPAPAEDFSLQGMQRGSFGLSSNENKPRKRALHDPRDIVQTGPGVPAWTWRSMDLQWSGPVERTQQLRLILIPPAVTSLLGFLRVLLLAALILRAILPRDFDLRRLVPRRRSATPAPAAAAVALALACLLSARSTASVAEEAPSTELLDELRARLLAKPDCAPTCADVSRLALDADPTTLRLRLEVVAEAQAPVALPGAPDHWSPSSVMLDGRPADALARSGDGVLWLLVPAGVHQVLLEGALPDRDVVSVPLPAVPRAASATARGWIVSGVHDGRVDSTVQLSREGERTASSSDELAPSVLPPFVVITRRLDLGLTWGVATEVRRLGASRAPVVVRVPLLPGEAVATADVRVEDGHAAVTLGTGNDAMSWWSTLQETTSLELVAPETTDWTEIWQVDASPSWHLETTGIPPVRSAAGAREWRPWPGEKLALAITRPEAVEGASLTIDSSVLTLSPGLRATDAALGLTLRSSRGGTHAIELPEGAELQSVTMNGGVQPVRQEGRVVTLAITPGSQHAVVSWRQADGLALRWKSPVVDLRAPSVNATTIVTLPRRWVLCPHGPRLGPAVLWWSLLAVMALIALALSRARLPHDDTSLTPLGFVSWLLLFVGLSQVSAWMAAVVVVWFLLLSLRRRNGAELDAGRFNAVQVLLVLWTAVSLVILFVAIQQGLLGDPRMQVAGNGSTAETLRWYADRADGPLPIVSVVSAPLLAYRLAMLAWALWLASALIGWLRWGWDCFTSGGAWKHVPREPQKAKPPSVTPPVTVPTDRGEP